MAWLALCSAGADTTRAPQGRLDPVVYSHECSCSPAVHRDDDFIFYNRVPKCGSTSMLSFLKEASVRNGFGFGGSVDYDDSHFAPNATQRAAIAAETHHAVDGIRRASGTSRAVYHRHVHYIDFPSAGGWAQPVYINLVREPAELRASSFYFYRECVCNQRTNPANPNGYDEWCRADWHKRDASTGSRKAFCEYTINDCYDGALGGEAQCRRVFGDNALGGSELTDFFCGGDDAADGGVCSLWEASPQPTAEQFRQKAARAIFHLKNRYRWVGVLEHFEASLRLLQHQLPAYFDHMDPAVWGRTDVAPDGHNNTAAKGPAFAPPTPATAAAMRSDASLAMDLLVYEAATQQLDCRLRACGLEGLPAATGYRPSSRGRE